MTKYFTFILKVNCQSRSELTLQTYFVNRPELILPKQKYFNDYLYLLRQMDLATNRHYLRPSRSLNRSHNLLNNTEHQVSTDYTNVSARDSHQSQLPKKSARNSLKNVMQAGYVRPPPTIVKPFNLSRSQSRPNTHREESVQKSAKPTPRPSFTKPFVVYRSDKPLTIPQEFQLTGR